jgi:hypothetical protein
MIEKRSSSHSETTNLWVQKICCNNNLVNQNGQFCGETELKTGCEEDRKLAASYAASQLGANL